MRPATLAIVLSLCIGALALLSIACLADEKRAYIEANETLVQQIPVFPGAVETQRMSTGYHDTEGISNPVGYNTFVQYRVPETTTAEEVGAFFSTVPLPEGWTRSVNLPYVNVCAGRAVLRVETDRVLFPITRVYEIYADQHGRLVAHTTCP